MKKVITYTTGSRWGYVHVADQGVESDFIPIPATLRGIRGNLRKALEAFRRHGCTHYTVANDQGVPCASDGLYHYSTSYCYTVYTGYTVEGAANV